MLMKLESHPKYNEGMVIDRKEIHEPRMPLIAFNFLSEVMIT